VFLIGFPLLLIPLTIFNIIVFMMPGLRLDTAVAVVPLMSGRTLPLTLGDALVLLSIFLLLVELVKAARPGAKYVMDHFLSLLAFAGAAAELILLPHDAFASIPFAFLVALMFVDAIGGPMIGLRRRRRVEPQPARVEPQPASVPERVEPTPAPAPTVEPAARVQPPPLPSAPPAESAEGSR
jgi:hypothetical protein